MRLLLSTLACAVTVMAIGTAEVYADGIKLTGCLVRGEGDGGYLLTNAPGDPSWVRHDDEKVAPSTVGTTGTFASIFYWLDGSGDLQKHVGHHVEIEGDLKGSLKEGEIKADRKDGWTEVEISSDGRKMKANVPNASVVAGPDGKREKGEILVRRVAVEHVKMLGASCQP